MKKLKIGFIAPLIFFVLITFIYLHNSTRDVYSGDVGDLVTASAVCGVAHPPGYPLFVALGCLFSRIPLPLPLVSRVGLISVLASVASLLLFYRLSLKITKHMFLSLIAVSTLSFSYFFWLHAELPEVFGLNNLFVMSILYLSYLFYKEKQEQYLFILAFVIGLSLTHHHTILLLFPAVGILVLKHVGFIFKSPKRVAFSIGLFILGLLAYIYVPVAASFKPIINWDNAVTVSSFIRLLLRQDYGGFAPSVDNGIPVSIKFITTIDYFKTLTSVFSYQILFLAIVGVVRLIRKDRWLFFSLFIAFIVSGPFFVFYSTTFITTTAAWGILERFYIMSTVVFVVFIPFGLLELRELIQKRFSGPLTDLLISYFLIVPVMMLIYNFPKTDLSKTQIGNTVARDILAAVPKNSLLYVSGDTTVFNTWYIHYALGERKDIALINPPGVGGNAFLDEEINKYHQNHPNVPNTQILNKTLEELRKKRPIYGTYKMEFVPADSVLVPKGLVYELMYKKDVVAKDQYIADVEKRLKQMHVARREKLTPAEMNLVITEIPLIYSNALIRVGDYIDSHYKDPVTAEHYYRRALWIDPENPAGYAGLSLSQYKGFKDCRNSLTNMAVAIEIYPVWKQYYLQQFILYRQCKADTEKIEELKQLFKQRFNLELEKETKKEFGENYENRIF